MTAAKRDGVAIMRLERIFHDEIDFKKVHHVAGGPYKGILINKTAESKYAFHYLIFSSVRVG
jgi:hypothetical protein